MPTVKTGAKAGAEQAAPPLDDAIDISIRTAETVVKAGTEAACKGFETVARAGREAIAGSRKGAAGAEAGNEAARLPQAGFEAMAEAGSVLVEGIGSINDRAFRIARRRLAEGVDARKALLGATSFEEALDIQQGYAGKAFESAVRDGAELAGAWIELAARASRQALTPGA